MNNIVEIERYIEGRMEPTEAVLFEEKMQGDALLKLNVTLQRKVLALVRMYHRKRLRMELEEVHERLFNDPGKVTFRERVARIFTTR